MDRASVVLTTLIVYKLALLGIGWFAERRTHGEADFLLGGRRLGPLVAAISASASSSSVWTLLGVSGYAYKNGLSAVWLFPACVGGFVINWCLIAPRMRRAALADGALTVTEFLVGRQRGAAFTPARVVASLVVLVSLTGYVAAQFNGAGKTFAAQCGFGEVPAIALGGAIIVVYTILGGFWAASLTDTLQGLLMALTAILLPVAALVELGGPTVLVERLQSVDGNFGELLPAGDGYAPFLILMVLLSIGIGYPGQPHVVNRFMALRDEASLRKARVYSLLWAAIVFAGMILLGLCGRFLMADVADDETLFFGLTNQLFPMVMAGILTAAVLSAVMSTADSQLLVAASAVSHDLGWRGATDRATLTRSRLVVLAVASAAVLVAIYGSREIFSSVLIAWTAIGAAFGPLLIVTLWRGPVGPRISLAALLIGFGTTLIAHAIPATRGTVIERTLPYVLTFVVLGLAPRSGRRQ